MHRLIFRAILEDSMTNKYDLRVTANEHGLLSFYTAGTPMAMSSVGFRERDLPASVIEGGETNKEIARRVKFACSYKIIYEWIEPQP